MHVLVRPQRDGSFLNVSSGDVYRTAAQFPTKSVYSQSVAQCVMRGAAEWTNGYANRHGQLTSAFGKGVWVRDFQSAYPGCDTSEDAARAEVALVSAGLTRGHSPSGRALDYARRTSKKLRQWRAPEPLQEIALEAVYGGVQFGGTQRPPRVQAGKTRVTEDIISSYPFTAAQRLPSVAHCTIERGMRKNAVLYLLIGTQKDAALFTRSRDTYGDISGVGYGKMVAGWYTPEEIDYHVSHGRVKVESIAASLTCSRWNNFLAPIVEHLFDQREQHPRGTPERAVLKSALNGLIGKFAAPLSSWRTASELEAMQIRRSREYPLISIGPIHLVDDPHLRGLFHRDTNGLWTALSYSRARVRLWQKMDDIRAQGGRVRWVHTDCVIADVPQTYVAAYGTGLGDWRRVE